MNIFFLNKIQKPQQKQRDDVFLLLVLFAVQTGRAGTTLFHAGLPIPRKTTTTTTFEPLYFVAKSLS